MGSKAALFWADFAFWICNGSAALTAFALGYMFRCRQERPSNRPLVQYNLITEPTKAAPEHLLVRLGGGSYRRISWGRLSAVQWRALWAATTEAELVGAGAPFSKAELHRVRDEFIRLDLAYWNNPEHHAQGWRLKQSTRRAIVKRFRSPPLLQ